MERKLAGWLNVDSGQLFITDPAHLDTWAHGDYTEGVEATNSYARVTTHMLSQVQGEVEFGVVVATDGDGQYPVYVTVDDDGRVLKAEILLDGSE